VTDRISLNGLEVFGHHGVLAHERAEGQRFVIDLVLHLDASAAAEGDRLELSVDYGAIAQRVHDAVAADPVDLLETVAVRVAQVCLSFERVERVEVTVHKPDAPLAVAFSDVAVTIERSRP